MPSRIWRTSLTTLSLGLAFMCTTVHAQDKAQVRELAKTYEAQMRNAGEPRDRCSLNANIHEGPVVIRTSGASALKPGDQLLVVNQINLAGKRPEDVIAILRELAPTASVPITLDRQGELLDLEVACTNARVTTEPLLSALSLAAKGKFDDCVTALEALTDIDTRSAALKAQCAAVSRNPARNGAPKLLVQAMEMAIEDARFVPSLRPELVQQLRNLQGQITSGTGASSYQALIEKTKEWPGGESLYAASEPDWALFRRNAESSIRSRLIDPESARIEWTHGFLLGSWRPFMSSRIEGYWTCGLVNARNRMGGYTGSSAFVVVLDPSGFVKYVNIGESKDFDTQTAMCQNSVKLLPPPPAQLTGAPGAGAPSMSSSVADEIKKLVELKNAGALTEAEFQAAKQKLLGTAN